MASLLEPKSKKPAPSSNTETVWSKLAKKGWLGDRAQATATHLSDKEKKGR